MPDTPAFDTPTSDPPPVGVSTAAPAKTGLTRRRFLAGGLAAGAVGAAGAVVARHLAAPAPAHHRGLSGAGTLVLVTLYGGNDGLNTVIPYEDGSYLGGRAQLGYQPNEVLPLADGLGLHPNLKGLKGLWEARQLAIVRGVGYPNPNRSHFRSMDIWQSAAPDRAVGSGWLGRWLDTTSRDPLLGLAVGPTLPLALTGDKVLGGAVPVGNLRLPGTTALQQGYASLERPGPLGTPLMAQVAASGADLLRIQHTLSDALAHVPANEGGATTNLEGTSGPNSLGTQLDLVSRSIRAGVPTRAYAASLGGFDTHANEKATHARLMAEIDTALTGFLASLGGAARGQGVVVLVHSEFGRRVAANASGGTDHGTAAPVLALGPSVKGGFYGEEPSLTGLDQGDLKYTTDFRSVYATVL